MEYHSITEYRKLESPHRTGLFLTLILTCALSVLLSSCAGQPGPPVRRDLPQTIDPVATEPSTVDSIQSDPALTLHLLRVTSISGGGDAILVADSTVTPARHLLIDTGDNSRTAAQLLDLGITDLDLVILTHAHHDHYGGLNAILDSIPVRAFAFNGQVRTAVTYRRLLERIEREIGTIIVVDDLRRLTLGEGDSATVVTLIPPRPTDLATDTNDGRRLNNGSLGIRLDRGEFSFLSTGDAQLEANRYFVTEFPELIDVRVLKAGHHGANNAIQEFWLEAIDPELVLISANGTTHPHAEALELIERRGIPLYCTPRHDRITLRVGRSGEYLVETLEAKEQGCDPGSTR